MIQLCPIDMQLHKVSSRPCGQALQATSALQFATWYQEAAAKWSAVATCCIFWVLALQHHTVHNNAVNLKNCSKSEAQWLAPASEHTTQPHMPVGCLVIYLGEGASQQGLGLSAA